MAEYDCPNCGTYRGPHEDRCISGGLRANGIDDMYAELNKKLEALWMDHRLHGTQITKGALQDIIDKSWQETRSGR
jgi:hypothetical protein